MIVIHGMLKAKNNNPERNLSQTFKKIKKCCFNEAPHTAPCGKICDVLPFVIARIKKSSFKLAHPAQI